jgi:hypothetical protein
MHHNIRELQKGRRPSQPTLSGQKSKLHGPKLGVIAAAIGIYAADKD